MHLTLAVLLLATAPSSADKALRQELQAAYDALAAAYVHQDVAAVMAMLSPDVQWTLVDGSKLHREGVESATRDFVKTLGVGSQAKYTIVSMQRRGDDVLVDVRLTVTAVQPDYEHEGQTVKHLGRSGWHDVWVKGASGWLYKSGVEYELPSNKKS
jgi:ketosteroid isomerase-like protein